MGEIAIGTEASLTVVTSDAIAERLADYARQADGALSPNTERAIRADTAVFMAWCGERDLVALPASPETVAAFVDAMAESRKPATVRRYVASVAHLHRAAGLDDPSKGNAVRLAMKRLGRQHGTRQDQAAPLGELAVERVLATTGDTMIDRRDLALVMVARDMLARRSEVVALQVEDVTFGADGTATVLVRRSKTDTAGEGAVLWLSPRTTAALRRWLDGAGVTTGPLFRSVGKGGAIGGALDAGDVARRFKVMAERAGINPAAISGHSARVGMAQDLVAHGAELPAVMVAGRWKSPTMPARYAERLSAGRGAVAQYYGRRG
ncbi:MAG: tyrosine-type recombinase/integrase [Rhodospirillaceae bacterium]